MLNVSPIFRTFRSLDTKNLVTLKTKAMRSGAWFKALQRIDRVLLELTIRVVDSVRSTKLADRILSLARKLEDFMSGSFSVRLMEIGLPLAHKISSTAQKLGNICACNWVFDSSFAIFLAVVQINTWSRNIN